MVEYPAAHSMDTRWFAVDADGNVAVFDSHEDGALPTNAGTLGGAAEPSFDAMLYYATVTARRIVAGTSQARPAGDVSGERVLVVLPAPGSDAMFDVLATSPWIGLSKQPLSAKEIATLGATLVIASGELYDLADGSVYLYGRDHGDDPGRYTRSEAPTDPPLKVDELPPGARTAVGALRVPVAFATTEAVHLGDYLSDADAQYYGDNWTLRGFGDASEPPPTAKTVKPGFWSRLFKKS